MPQHTMRAIRTIAWLTTPAMLVLLLVGKQVLGAFGSAYAAGGTSFLYLVTITAVLVSVNTLYGSIFKVRHNLTAIFVTDAVYVASLFGLLYFYIPLGLLGVGIAWLGGTAAMSLACFLFYRGTTPQLA
jgi:O-antigen/teichoic acid export membrane protein